MNTGTNKKYVIKKSNCEKTQLETLKLEWSKIHIHAVRQPRFVSAHLWSLSLSPADPRCSHCEYSTQMGYTKWQALSLSFTNQGFLSSKMKLKQYIGPAYLSACHSTRTVLSILTKVWRLMHVWWKIFIFEYGTVNLHYTIACTHVRTAEKILHFTPAHNLVLNSTTVAFHSMELC